MKRYETLIYVVQYFEGRLHEVEEEREVAIQQAVESALSLKLRKMHTRYEKVESESKDLREVTFYYLSYVRFAIDYVLQS